MTWRRNSPRRLSASCSSAIPSAAAIGPSPGTRCARSTPLSLAARRPPCRDARSSSSWRSVKRKRSTQKGRSEMHVITTRWDWNRWVAAGATAFIGVLGWSDIARADAVTDWHEIAADYALHGPTPPLRLDRHRALSISRSSKPPSTMRSSPSAASTSRIASNPRRYWFAGGSHRQGRARHAGLTSSRPSSRNLAPPTRSTSPRRG